MGLSKTLDCGCGCGGMKKSDMVKFKYAFYSAIIFMILSSPQVYTFTTKHIGSWITRNGVVPTPGGLILHSFIFMIIVFLLMKIRT